MPFNDHIMIVCMSVRFFFLFHLFSNCLYVLMVDEGISMSDKEMTLFFCPKICVYGVVVILAITTDDKCSSSNYERKCKSIAFALLCKRGLR